MAGVLGIDIGGANIKTAQGGTAKTHPFEVWKHPDKLEAELGRVLKDYAFDQLAVTMTAELCDCYTSRREGVTALLRAVQNAAPSVRISVWSTAGQFVDGDVAVKEYLAVASANWHALATFAGRFAPQGTSLLVDVGSTTTDIVPITAGKPTPKGLKDYDRRQTSELLYIGVRRTPVCALLGPLVLAEVFATSLDAFLITGEIAEEPENRMTADGRPATRADAHARLARMLGGDGDTCPKEETQKLAAKVVAKAEEMLFPSIRRVSTTLPGLPTTIILSGAGEFLATRVAKKAFPTAQLVSLSEKLGPEVSKAACAHAVSVLAQESAS